MIIEKKVDVKITKRNIDYYSLYYSVKLKDTIPIDIDHLPRGSNKK